MKARRLLSLFCAVIIVFSCCFFTACDLLKYLGINISFEKENATISGELSFHFLELGNEYAGDCIYIKAGENDILIDAGSREGSVPTIKAYVDRYCKDGVLEYVIVTHADQDHIAGFAASKGIFYYYKCQTIIDFPMTDKTTKTYNNYVTNRDNEVTSDNAVHYTALDCYRELNGAKREMSLSDSVSMEVLYNYYYENSSKDENNYSVCVMFKHGDRKFLFTGDLEKEGEEELVKNNTLSQVELYKAGHHGSKTSSNDCLLSIIKPKICVVCCCAGSVEYTQAFENTFPTQKFIDRISKYTDKVYVTTMIDVKFNETKNKYENSGEYKLLNGNIVVISDQQEVKVECSYSNKILKETEWFIQNRTMPSYWR